MIMVKKENKRGQGGRRRKGRYKWRRRRRKRRSERKGNWNVPTLKLLTVKELQILKKTH